MLGPGMKAAFKAQHVLRELEKIQEWQDDGQNFGFMTIDGVQVDTLDILAAIRTARARVEATDRK